MPTQLPELKWISPEENPWGVRLLDLRPVTLGMISTSADPECAANALSYGHEDGSSFVHMEPNSTRIVGVGLRYRIEQPFVEGALFIPGCMEHKWAIFYRGGKILFVRSWTRELYAVGKVKINGDELEITIIQGDLVEKNEDPSYKKGVVDYMMRSHALDVVYPVPMNDAEEPPSYIAMWCFQGFGNRALFATPDGIAYRVPEKKLRTWSARR